jgi:hypothetical protein
VSSGTSTQLQRSTNAQTVLAWAQNENKPTLLQWAQTAPAADIDTMADIVKVWLQYGYCPTADCQSKWAYISGKYPTVFAYIVAKLNS